MTTIKRIFSLVCIFSLMIVTGCLPLSSSNTVASANIKQTTDTELTDKSHTPNKVRLDRPLLIKAKGSEAPIKIKLENQVLKLGQTQIKHWPFEVPSCQDEKCELTITRRHYPDGPNTLIQLSKIGKTLESTQQWFLIESWQKRLNIKRWDIRKNKNDSITIKANDKTLTLKQGDYQKIEHCMVNALWIESFGSNKKPAVKSRQAEGAPIKAMIPQLSDDKPKQRLQLLIECP